MSDTTAGRTKREQLLAQAARCYREGGRELDACRCLEHAGDFTAAAFLHERSERWQEAAVGFERAQQWPLAARCFLAAGRPMDAARCQLAARNPLEAAWLFAHHARRFDRAHAALAGFRAEGAEQELALLLVNARCALPRRPAEAGRGLRRVFDRLGELREGPGRDRVMNWAFALTHEVMDRPDLTTELMVAAWEAGIDTRGRWEQWAGERLGSAEAVGYLVEAGEEGETPGARPDGNPDGPA